MRLIDIVLIVLLFGLGAGAFWWIKFRQANSHCASCKGSCASCEAGVPDFVRRYRQDHPKNDQPKGNEPR